MKIKVLCLSRSYLSILLPKLADLDKDRDYYHIVQSTLEEERITQMGGKVVLNIEKYVREQLSNYKENLIWEEPADFRKITNFNWSPIITDRFLKYFGKDDRNKIAAAVYKGISEIIKQRQYNYFLSEPVALFTTHVLLYHCKKYNIQPKFWTPTFFPNRFYFSSEIVTSTPIAQTKRILSDKEVQDLREFTKNLVEDKVGPAYHYKFASKTSKQKHFSRKDGSSAYLVEPGLVSIIIQMLKLIRARVISFTFPHYTDFQSAKTWIEHYFYLKCLLTPRGYYDSLPLEVSDDNILYPLHFEPEGALDYYAPPFADQFELIQTIINILPPNKILWVKDHPNQFGALGLKKWKRLRKKHQNIRYIYGRLSGRELIKKMSLVITVSSSAGLDALLMDKKVVVLGDVFYQYFKGAERIRSKEELAEVLSDPLTFSTNQQNHESVTNSLIDFSSLSFPGYPAGSTELYSKKNLEDLVFAFKQEFV